MCVHIAVRCVAAEGSLGAGDIGGDDPCGRGKAKLCSSDLAVPVSGYDQRQNALLLCDMVSLCNALNGKG